MRRSGLSSIGRYGTVALSAAIVIVIVTLTTNALGIGEDSVLGQSPPEQSNDFFQIVSGKDHACTIRSDGSIDCWGGDEFGQVSQRPRGGRYVALSSGETHTCALRSEGDVICWGSLALDTGAHAAGASPTATATHTPTPTPTATPTPTSTATATPTGTPTVTKTPTATPRPTRTPSPTPTTTPTPRPARPTLSRAFPSITIPGGAYEMAYPNDGSNRLFVSSKDGRIFVFENGSNVSSMDTFLDISGMVYSSGSETGLLGFAFDPGYRSNGYFYVHYNVILRGSLQSVVSRFKVSANDRDAADPASEKEIMRFDQPGSNHNGGKIAFGGDGYLYISFGDGGPRPETSQDRTNLFGSIIRINVKPSDDSVAYTIPSSNPFVGAGGGVREEIWAYGLRNPWRFSFDRRSGTLWAGDVGQNSYEEVDIIKKGLNYGWPVLEGFSCYLDSDCDRAGFEPPVAVYNNTGFAGDCSIIGGYVYRGSRAPSLAGWYIYGDYCSGKIWALRHNGSRVTGGPTLLFDASFSIVSFGEDQSGEVYVLTPGGQLYVLGSNR